LASTAVLPVHAEPAHILLANRDDPHYFLNLYARRSLRIWPIYYPTLSALLAAYVLLPNKLPPIGTGEVLQYLTYTQFMQRIWGLPEHPRRAYNHTWTLAIEEQFYLVWPLAVRFLPRRLLWALCAAIAAGSATLRAAGVDKHVLPARCDGFALGALLALMLSGPARSAEGRRKVLPALVAAATIGGVAVVFGLTALPLFALVLPLNFLFFGLIGVVVLDAGRGWLAFLQVRPLVYLGTISYGLYLYHYPVIWALSSVAKRFGAVSGSDQSLPLSLFGAELVVSVAIAAVSWRFVERPILGFKARFQNRAGLGGAERASRVSYTASSSRRPLGSV
jgi:peptidoglycan/LPS O-acetylase OafA/YrhL